jgi:hypothetical protein
MLAVPFNFLGCSTIKNKTYGVLHYETINTITTK